MYEVQDMQEIFDKGVSCNHKHFHRYHGLSHGDHMNGL